MKRLISAAVITLFSFLVLHSDTLAGSIQGSATVRLLSDLRNPVQGTLGLEQSGVRLTGSLGNNSLLSGSVDLLARSKDGLYVGVGANVDRLSDADFLVTTDSDTTTTVRPHDHGKHKGDKHVRKGKTTTIVNNSMSIVSIGGTDLGISPSLLLGVAARRGLFVESRVLLGTDVSNRTSVGIRF